MNFTKAIWTSLLIASTAGTAANAAEIVPFAAKYNLSLKDMNVPGQPGRAGGTMEFRFSRDCFHWWSDRELKFNVLFADGRKMDLVITERLRETLSGKLFWFWSRTTLNGQTVSIVAGKARRPDENEMVDVEPSKPESKETGPAITAQANTPAAKDAATSTPVVAGAANAADGNKKPDKAVEKPKRPLGVRVDYEWPSIAEMELAADVVFPVAALRQQLDALAVGALLREQSVLTGSRGKGAARLVYSKIVPPAIRITTLPDGDVRLLDVESWRFKASYFPLEGGKSAKPIKTIVQKVHANGVISETLMDLGLFSIEGKINWIKELPLPECE